jgi:hypothetical protein
VEYKKAFPSDHRCGQFLSRLRAGAEFIPDGILMPFANCSLHKNLDTIEAYRVTMNQKWQEDVRPPTWANRVKPEWAG